MKTIFTALIVFTLTLSYNYSIAQIPEYTLEVKNFTLVNPNKITFEIFLTHTDANTYEYASSQIFLRIPASGFGTFSPGTGSNSPYQNDSANGDEVSDLPQQFRPRGPSLASAGAFFELRLGSNILPGAGNGYLLPQGIPFMIKKMKLTSNTPFNLSNASFVIRDSCNDSPVPTTRTKVNSYVGTANIEITRCINHSVDLSGISPPPSTVCNIKLAIEGLYKPSTGRMVQKEIVSAYIRNASSPYQIVDSASAEVDSANLTGSFQFNQIVSNGDYYIVMKHKNSLETWSKTGGLSLVVGDVHTYDFTASASQAYGDNMRLMGSRYCFYTGEVNRDLIIDISDMAMVDNDSYHLISGEVITDLNGDDVVDLHDMAVIDNNRLRLTKSPLTGY